MWEVTGKRVGEDGSFLMELLKIASGNQIRSIKILRVAVAEQSKTENSNVKTERRVSKYKAEEKFCPQCPLFVRCEVCRF